MCQTIAGHPGKRQTHLGLHDEPVRGSHLPLVLLELVPLLVAQVGVAARQCERPAALDLLDLAHLLLLVLALAGRELFLLLDLLDHVRLLKRDDAVQIHARLDLDDRELAARRLGHALDGDLADPRVSAARNRRVFGVARLELKRPGAVEGEDLGRRDGVGAREDNELGALVGVALLLLPLHLDRVEVDVVDGKLADAEDGRERRARKRRAAADGLVGVERKVERLAREKNADALLDGGDTGGPADELDGVDLVRGEAGLLESVLERGRDALEEVRGELFKFFAREGGRSVDVVHDRLYIERCLGVGREHLLQPLGARCQAEDGLGAGHDVDLVLGLELLGKVLDEGIVKVATAKVAVVRGGLDGELALGVGDDRDRVVGVADIDKADVARLVGRGRQVRLGDAVPERDGGRVVDEAERVQAGDLRSVEQRAALVVGVPPRYGNDDVRDGLLELGRGRVPQLREVGRDELRGREDGRLAEILDLGCATGISTGPRRSVAAPRSP